MGSQQGAPAAKDAALRADAEVVRDYVANAGYLIVTSDGLVTAVPRDSAAALAALDALVASLTAARQERDDARGEATYLTRQINLMRRAMQAAGSWEQFCSDYARYSDGRAVLAGEAPPTAPPESVRQEQPDDAADAEADS